MPDFSVKLNSAHFGLEVFEIVNAADAATATTTALARHAGFDYQAEFANQLSTLPLPSGAGGFNG